MKIRQATIEDVPQIIPIWQEMMAFHAERDAVFNTCEGDEEAFSKYACENIEKDDACVLVAQDNGNIVGYCQCLIVVNPPVLGVTHYGNIGDLAILGDYRRKGIGERFVEKAMAWFKAKGLERVEVRVAVTNEISTKFWRKMGFATYLETMFKQA